MQTFLALLITSLMWAGEWVPMVVSASGYCPCTYCCGSRAAGVTADQTKVKDVPYAVASDPQSLPFGTVLWIPLGHGYLDRSRTLDDQRQFVVDDTGGYLRTQTRRTGVVHIDLRFKYHGTAKRFGRKKITIYVWKE
jgi:3D (Asp-Asp-Asp) domain-containing protein